MNLSLQLDIYTMEYLPGSEVKGTVVAVHPGGEWIARHIDVVLFWRTSGKGNRDEGIAAVVNLAQVNQRIPANYPGNFSLRLPAHPSTYHGRTLKINWYVGAYAVGSPAVDQEVEIQILVHSNPEQFAGWNEFR